MNKLKVLDLFSGIGGFSLGLESTGGFETVAFCEIDKHCQKVLKKHWSAVPIVQNVKELTSDLLEFSANRLPIDIICGGFPCQDISIGGKRNGIKDGTRSGLWFEFKRIIGEIRPKYAIIENVAAIRGNGLGQVIQDLSEIGYDCEWHCIRARSVGHLHQRDRMWIIAYPSGQRQYEYSREERQLQINQVRTSEKTHKNWPQCLAKPVQVRPILSRRQLDCFRASYSSRGALVSKLRRVTNGISFGLDERRRRERIKQLGNAVVPQIPQLIGEAILEYERSRNGN